MRTVVALKVLTVLGMVFSSPAAQASDRVYYFHNDHLGTPQALSDAAGWVVWEAEYDPFGKATVNEDPDGDGQIVVNNLRFPGQYYDAETGLHYNYHRDYDPSTGRYLTPDPIGLAGGLNLYGYVLNDPINFTDPWGLIRWNHPPPQTVPVTGQTLEHLQCVERCLQGSTGNSDLDLLMTGGAEQTGHGRPASQGGTSHHYRGEACDIHGSNPVQTNDVMSCSSQCGFGAGQYEEFPNSPNRNHWHLQETPGNGVPPIPTAPPTPAPTQPTP